MTGKFLETMVTPAVRAAQEKYFGRAPAGPTSTAPAVLTDAEMEFIRARDSFYLGTISESGWPYIQHRGGPAGFLQVMSPQQLAFADVKGNRQLLSTGNVAANDRVCLFLMDYPQRARLKILGRAQVLAAREHPQLAAAVAPPEWRASMERIFVIAVEAFDWNCPQHITPRYTAEEVAEALTPLQQRIAELEAQIRNRN